ncbi:hypothetical protein HZC07_01365, partial [Candidatus Micrarchaeota archaeon]|nr:hypothetical protein [Candidatus Micrarchaeota archaeon]
MDSREKLLKSAEENKTILCFGVDPDIGKINAISPGTSVENTIAPYFHEIIDQLMEEN